MHQKSAELHQWVAAGAELKLMNMQIENGCERTKAKGQRVASETKHNENNSTLQRSSYFDWQTLVLDGPKLIPNFNKSIEQSQGGK